MLRLRSLAALLTFASLPAHAAVIGQILTCYACNSTGNAAVDAALTANPDVASDGILFAIVNTSSSNITGGIFSVTNASPNDQFLVPTIGAGSTFILIQGRCRTEQFTQAMASFPTVVPLRTPAMGMVV